jgi:serine phosphatase RsbU (regulator of sigma subunit)
MASSIVAKRQVLSSGKAGHATTVFRHFNGVCVGGLTLPMPPDPVGGDRIGAVAVCDGFVSFVTDGQGKGTMASRLGATMRQCVLCAISSGATSPTTILHKLNRTLLSEHILGAAAILHCDGGRLTASVAGSPAPVLFHPDGRMERFPICGTILGLSSVPEFDVCYSNLLPSTFVALFSDGVTEAENQEEEPFAVERFSEFLDPSRSLAANLLCCVDAVLAHSGQQQDDLSLLIAHANGLAGAAPRPAIDIPPRDQNATQWQLNPPSAPVPPFESGTSRILLAL